MEDYLIVRHPSEEFRKKLIQKIKMNGGYCPSKPIKTPDTKCHCKHYRETGDCECGLFIKVPCIEV